MPNFRALALAPLSRADAERLLPLLTARRQGIDRRVLRARCLKYLESFDVAWAELKAVLHQLEHDELLAARVAVDLVHLAYYLVRGEEVERLHRLAERRAASDPLMLAELRLGMSINATAANDVSQALRDARWAEDALAAAPRGRGRDLVATRLQRQLAHLLSHAGDYAGALAAAESTARHAGRVGDPWETAWATYTLGFVHWYAGRIDEAVDDLTRAESALRSYGSSVWRYTLLCLARARLERGELADGERLARQSATGAPEDHAHIALLRGEPDVAHRILTRAAKGFPADEHFRDFVRGVVRARRGDPRGGVRMLDEAAKEFESRGMRHWAIGAAAHAAFARESFRPVGGEARAGQLVHELAARGGEGFAYYLPDVAVWLGRAAEHEPGVRDVARTMRVRGEAAIRRAKRDVALAVGTSALDEATFYLRTLGLTWRELAVLHEIEQARSMGEQLARDGLASRLEMSPNTLRVHLTRIRAKLDVGDERGDDVLLEAALNKRPVS
ncbi:MAG: tetratricopeptide repeat protein [Candidatus Limnocylindria bacterium]